MFGGRRLTKVLLRCVTFALFSGGSALDSGVFHACPQGSCNSSLSSNLCPVENNACKCAENNSSACDSLDQQTFVNLTGATNESASQWTCCLCSLNSSYCCNKCSNSTSIIKAADPAIDLSTRYFRILLVFVLECNQFSNEEDNLNNSLKQGINNLTGMPLDQVTVIDTSCVTGQRPYCGVDVEGIRAHHRAKRLAVGGRMKGKSKSKKNPKDNSYDNSYGYQGSSIDVTCDSLSANMTVYGKNVTSLEMSLDLLRQLQLNNSLDIPLWDRRVISSSFMLSAMDGTSYSLHEARTPKSLSPTKGMPPLTVDLKPMIYAAAAFGGLITLCILWKFIKHSWLLSRKKFTSINSDRVDQKKSAQQLTKQQKIMQAMEENDRMPHANGNAFTISGLPRSNGEATKEHHNWSSPGYPARSLVPAYKPTELHNQRTPPRLILDDDGSDIEDRRSIDSGSIVNLGDEENLSDILNSDDERALRPSSVSPHFSQGIRNPGFIEGITSDETTGEPHKMRRKPKSPSLANGSAKLSVNTSDVQEERKASIISSDLSLDAGENTFFLPLKKDKNKKQEKPKKSKNFLSANAEKNLRRGSITPVNEDKGPRINSATEAKIPQKSPTLQVTEGEKRRKSITNTTDSDKKVVTPRDTYTKGKKATKVSTLENGTKTVGNEELDVGKTGGSGKGRNGRSISPVRPHLRKPISIVASGGDDEVSGRKQKRTMVTSATPFNERKKSTVADVEERESSRGKEIRLKEISTPPVNGRKNSMVANDSKRKKKKQKNDKEKKRKTVESDDSSEEAMATSPEGITGLNVTPASPGTQRRPSAVLQENDTKVKKKKKRKDREGKKRKTEDSELSGEDETAEDKTKQLDVDIAVPETKRRQSVVPNETQKKKKKQNEATTARRKSEIPTAKYMEQDTNGGFVQSAKSLRMDSLTVTPEKKRRKSLVIEDIDNKSQTSETASRRKSVSPDVPADRKRPGSDQNVTRIQPNSISPVPTGYKSPRLIIKPSYHQY